MPNPTNMCSCGAGAQTPASGLLSPAAPQSVRVFTPPTRHLLVCFPRKHLLHPRQAAQCWGPSHEQGQRRMRVCSPEKQTDAKQVITSLMDAMEEKQRELWEGNRRGPPTALPSLCVQEFTAVSPQRGSSGHCCGTSQAKPGFYS